MEKGFLEKLFVTRWVVLVIAMAVVGEITQAVSHVLVLHPLFSYAQLPLWLVLFTALAMLHGITFRRHFTSVSVAVGAGMLTAYGVVTLIYFYGIARGIEHTLLFSFATVLAFPTAVKWLEKFFLTKSSKASP